MVSWRLETLRQGCKNGRDCLHCHLCSSSEARKHAGKWWFRCYFLSVFVVSVFEHDTVLFAAKDPPARYGTGRSNELWPSVSLYGLLQAPWNSGSLMIFGSGPENTVPFSSILSLVVWSFLAAISKKKHWKSSRRFVAGTRLSVKHRSATGTGTFWLCVAVVFPSDGCLQKISFSFNVSVKFSRTSITVPSWKQVVVVLFGLFSPCSMRVIWVILNSHPQRLLFFFFSSRQVITQQPSFHTGPGPNLWFLIEEMARFLREKGSPQSSIDWLVEGWISDEICMVALDLSEQAFYLFRSWSLTPSQKFSSCFWSHFQPQKQRYTHSWPSEFAACVTVRHWFFQSFLLLEFPNEIVNTAHF